MDWKRVSDGLLSPVQYPFLASERIYWLYLLSAALIAALIYVGTRRKGKRRIGDFLRFLFPAQVYAHPSATIDYVYFFIHKGTYAAFVAPLLLGTLAFAGAVQALCGGLAGAAPALSPPALVNLAYAVLIVLAYDFGLFASHYLAHRIPFLWEFHKVHHSAQVLTPISVYRMHPVDDLFSGSVTTACVGAVSGVYNYFFVGGEGALTLDQAGVGLGAVLLVYYFLGYNLRHSHVWLSYPAGLSHILISPAQHQIHHSAEPRHFGRNLGFIFAFWDWAAGTLYVPVQPEKFPLGLGQGEEQEYDSILRLYLLPFRKIAVRLAPRRRTAR